MAKALLASGAGKGTRIGVLAPDGPLLLTTFYAALRIGALVTPISTLTTPPELAHIIRTSDAQLLVGNRRFLRNDFADQPRIGAPWTGRRRTRTLWLTGAPHLRSIWLDDASGHRMGPPDRRAAGSGRRCRRRAPRRHRSRGVTGRRCVRRLHLRQHGDTEGGRAQPALGRHQATGAGAHLPHGRRRPNVVAAARLLAGRHRRRAAGPVHGQHARLPTDAADRRRARHDRAPRRDLRGGVARPGQAAGGGQGAGHRRRPHPGHGLTAAGRARRGRSRPSLRANLLGMSESFSAHSGEPIDRRLPADKEGIVRSGDQRHRTAGGGSGDGRGGGARRRRRAAAPRRRPDDRLLQGRPRRTCSPPTGSTRPRTSSASTTTGTCGSSAAPAT